MVIGGWEWWQWIDYKRAQGHFWSEENILYLDFNGVYTIAQLFWLGLLDCSGESSHTHFVSDLEEKTFSLSLHNMMLAVGFGKLR